MAGKRLFIYQLPEKLEVLMHEHRLGTWEKFDDFSGIGIGTLKQLRKKDDPAAYSKLGQTHRDKLHAKFGFPSDMPEWIAGGRVPSDHGPGPDTAKAFAAAYRKMRADQDAVDVAKGGGVGSVNASKSDTIRDVTTELVAGKRKPTTSPLGTMAQLDLSLGQPVGPGAIQVLAELSCHATKIVGSKRRFSVRRMLLSIACGDARGRRSAIAGINGLAIVLQNSRGDDVRFAWLGTERLPCWEVSAGGAIIGYLKFDAGVIEQLAHGDVLRATLSAWLKHIDTDEFEEEPTFGIVDEDGRSSELPEDKLTIEQRRIIEHVNKLKLSTDGNGHAEIAVAELQLERKT